MISIEEFQSIAEGDVFYRGNTRYAVESIQHRVDNTFLGYPVHKAIARTMTKKSTGRTIQTGYLTFLGLSRFDIRKLVKKDKVRGTRKYAARKNYPFFLCFDTCELEKSETNDCTVRALSRMLDIPYDDAHSYLKKFGRVDRKGFKSSTAYKYKGLSYVLNTTGLRFGALVKSGLLPHRAIIQVNGHVVAVLDGTVYDTFRTGSNMKVKGWYKNADA